MPFPELPDHPEPYVFRWTDDEKRTIREYGEACARAEREACVKECAKRCVAAECVEGDWDRGYNAALKDCILAVSAR